MEKGRSYTLKIWRQKNAESKGAFKTYQVENVSPGSSFLEMLDILNEELLKKDEDPIHFDHDCRKGSVVCAACTSMDDPMDPRKKLLYASCICVPFPIKKRSP